MTKRPLSNDGEMTSTSNDGGSASIQPETHKRRRGPNTRSSPRRALTTTSPSAETSKSTNENDHHQAQKQAFSSDTSQQQQTRQIDAKNISPDDPNVKSISNNQNQNVIPIVPDGDMDGEVGHKKTHEHASVVDDVVKNSKAKHKNEMEFRSIGFIEIGETGEFPRQQRKNSSRQRKNSSQYKRYHPVIRLHPDEVPTQIKELWVKETEEAEAGMGAEAEAEARVQGKENDRAQAQAQSPVEQVPVTRSGKRRESISSNSSKGASSPSAGVNASASASASEPKKKNSLSKYIVYKYGICTELSEEDDHHFQFLIADPSQIISYEDGIAHNYDCIPPPIMSQLGSGKPLNDAGYRLVEALEVLKVETRRAPEDRVKWMEDFVHRQQEEIRKREEEERAKLKQKQLAHEKNLTLHRRHRHHPNEQQHHIKLKSYIASRIPPNVVDDFGRVGFARYDDYFFPVIQLSPFDLSPSCFRSEWMRMFNAWDVTDNYGRGDDDNDTAAAADDEDDNRSATTEASSVGNSFLRLVYWYGQDHSEEAREISLLHEDDFISYYDGVKRVAKFSSTWDIEPDMERYVKTGIREAEGDLKRPVNERVPWLKKIENEKKKILKGIPAEVTSDFRSVGWVFQSKSYLPVIVLTPFDVTGSLKDRYLEHIRKAIKMKQPIKRLVLWYGTQEKDSHKAFGFKRSSDIISYEEGKRRKLHIIPSMIQAKMKAREKLTYKQSLIAFGLKQMEKDVLLSREERPFALMLPNDEDECWEMLEDDDESDQGSVYIDDECTENSDSDKDDDESEKLFSTSEEEDDDDDDDDDDE